MSAAARARGCEPPRRSFARAAKRTAAPAWLLRSRPSRQDRCASKVPRLFLMRVQAIPHSAQEPCGGRAFWPEVRSNSSPPEDVTSIHAHADKNARPFSHDGRGHARQMAGQTRRQGRGRRHHGRDRNRQGDDGIRSGRRRHDRQHRGGRRHRRREGRHRYRHARRGGRRCRGSGQGSACGGCESQTCSHTCTA